MTVPMKNRWPTAAVLANFQRATGHSRLEAEALLLGLTVVSDEGWLWLWLRCQWRKWMKG